MAKKVKLAVLDALKKNAFIAEQPIHVKSKGNIVVLIGEVESEDLIFEAIATAEAVHPLLDVYSKLTINKAESKAEESTTENLLEPTAV